VNQVEEERKGLDRRSFLRRAALTGAAAAWAAPVVQTVAARPAFAQTGSPSECRHSVGPWFTNGQQQNVGAENDGGCKQACKHATLGDLDVNPNSDSCTQVCDAACPNVPQSDDRVCCDGSFCESTNWVRENGPRGGDYRVCYVGGATCSPVVCAQNY
jgi:hypothetical protein